MVCELRRRVATTASTTICACQQCSIAAAEAATEARKAATVEAATTAASRAAAVKVAAAPATATSLNLMHRLRGGDDRVAHCFQVERVLDAVAEPVAVRDCISEKNAMEQYRSLKKGQTRSNLAL